MRLKLANDRDCEGAKVLNERFLRWNPADHLQSEQDVTTYLAACLAEDPGDGSVVRAALDDVARARGATSPAQSDDNRR